MTEQQFLEVWPKIKDRFAVNNAGRLRAVAGGACPICEAASFLGKNRLGLITAYRCFTDEPWGVLYAKTADEDPANFPPRNPDPPA